MSEILKNLVNSSLSLQSINIDLNNVIQDAECRSMKSQREQTVNNELLSKNSNAIKELVRPIVNHWNKTNSLIVINEFTCEPMDLMVEGAVVYVMISNYFFHIHEETIDHKEYIDLISKIEKELEEILKKELSCKFLVGLKQ